MNTKKTFSGVDIKEVWDFRLSAAHPLLRNDIGDTWKVQIWSNDNVDYDPADPSTLAKPLEEHDTGIPCEKGDSHDANKVKACFAILYPLRDKYSRDHIEQRKPVVSLINSANAKASSLAQEIAAAKSEGNTELFFQKEGELKHHLLSSNAEIKKATKEFHDLVAKEGAL